MSLGTAIFLSSVVLGIVILFISTKGRWKWKKIILWPVLVLVGLSILLGAGYYIYTLVSNRPKLQTSFWGISLNSTRGDIKFLKGDPLRQPGDEYWFYIQGQDSLISIKFENDKIHYICYTGTNLYGPPLKGVNIGTSYDEIVKRFGPPSYVSISEDELERALSYDKYNLTFRFKENKVCYYGIYNNTLGPVRFKKEKKVDPK